MKVFSKPVRIKLAVGAALILTVSLFAALVFNPSSQPAVTVAPYAMNNTDLAHPPANGTKAYRPWFENGAWTGDLIEYDIASDGTRTTTATDVIGNFDTTDLLNHAADSTKNWTVRSRFVERENAVTDYWTTRNIYTFVDTNNDGIGDTQGNFLWNNLSDAQRAMLDQTTLDLGLTGSYDSDTLNFILGDHSHEKSETGGTLRIRFSLMGDVINSWPVYVGIPQEDYTLPGFLAFKYEHAVTNPRDGRIFVGSNNGFLEAFDEDDGSEVYAYLPSPLISKLPALINIPYQHTWYVDGQMATGSAQIDDTWKTILAGGLGAGGKLLYILDITDENPSDDKILYEKTGNDIGYIYGRPTIARLSDGNWYVFTGNGFDSVNNVAKLLLISLDDGSIQTLTTSTTGALAAPAVVDINRDFEADFAFAGDSNGDMWKFDLNNLGNAPVKIYDGNADQPITTRPAIGVNPNGGLMVLFGTGGVTSLADARNIDDTQALIGIWTNASSTALVTQTLAETTATFSSPDGSGGTTSNTETVRTVSNNAVDYICAPDDLTCSEKLGWKINLPNAIDNSGERVLGPVQLRNGRLIVTTTNPTGVDTDAFGNLDTDLDGNTWLMSVNYLTGSHADTIVFNLSGDDQLNDDDLLSVGGVDVPPVGLSLGDGNLSQPVIARRGSGSAIMFINGLRLPLPLEPEPGPLLSGHIDVQTDSPSTMTHEGGLMAKNDNKMLSEGYMTRRYGTAAGGAGGKGSDGLGRSVDGHVHQYDTIHGISYVDLFSLEERRGLGDLSTIVKITSDSADCTADMVFESVDHDSDPDTPDVTGCVQLVDPELNRLYDNYGAPNTDPAVAPPNTAEVFGRDTDAPLDPNQKFIIVVANGDLSPGASLQIGCKIYRNDDGTAAHNNEFLEYQDWLTETLEDLGSDLATTDLRTLRDPKYGEPVVYTLNEIASADVNDPDHPCPTDEVVGSPTGTVRVSFTSQSILSGGIHGTRAQCVLGLHDYRDKVCYSDEDVLTAAESRLVGAPLTITTYDDCDLVPDTIPNDYIREPRLNMHITKSMEGVNNKYRWRNGALTLQLLAVNNDGTPAFELQPADDLPITNHHQRLGGTYAKAFTKLGNAIQALDGDEGTNESGLLYEMSVYWHFSDLADNLRRAPPASLPCYGDSSYNSVLTQELGGLTLGEYNDLIDGLTGSNGAISQYSTLLDELEAALASGDQDAINKTLLALGKLIEDYPGLRDYIKYRDYAPGHVPEQHLLDIDKGLVNPDSDPSTSSTDDGIPVDVEDISTDELTHDFDSTAGRSSWIDLRP